MCVHRGSLVSAIIQDPDVSADHAVLTALFIDAQAGDKIVEISASFGQEVWKAENYGQVSIAAAGILHRMTCFLTNPLTTAMQLLW